MLFAAFALTGDRWGVITNAPREYAEDVWGRGALVAGIARSRHPPRRSSGSAPGGVRCSSQAWSSRNSSCSRRSRSTRSERIPPSSPAGCRSRASCPRRRAPLARVRDRRQALSEHRRRARAPGHSRARRALRQPIPMANAQTFIAAERHRSVHRDSSRGTVLRNNPMFDALVPPRRPLGLRDLVGRAGAATPRQGAGTRASTRTPPRVSEGVGRPPTSTASAAACTRRSRFSATRVAAVRTGAFVVDSFDPRHEAVVEKTGETTDDSAAHAHPGVRGLCGCGDRDRVTHRALFRRIRDPCGSTPHARDCSSCPTPTSPAGQRRWNGQELADLPDGRRPPGGDRAQGVRPASSSATSRRPSPFGIVARPGWACRRRLAARGVAWRSRRGVRACPFSVGERQGGPSTGGGVADGETSFRAGSLGWPA